jgi:hypothetical protein
MMDTVEKCGILLHQRPMLQDMLNVADPVGWLFFSTWFTAPDEPITDRALAESMLTVNGQRLWFLKALIDGKPEIINVEMEPDEMLTADRLRDAEPTICVHLTNDPASGFYCRSAKDVRILAPIRNWRVQSNGEVATGPRFQEA